MGGLSPRVADCDGTLRRESRGQLLEKKKRGRSEKLVSSVRQPARDQAEQEARRVPWQLLVEARNQYLDWQEFYYWARSIMESEDSIPNWLAKKLDELCPGFLAEEKQYLARHPNEASLTPVRLGYWIDEHIFSFAQQGGWLLAVTFYAVRESRYQKASVCWSESVEKWRKARPIQYPSFEQWRREAAQCDETARLSPRVRKDRACFRLVDAERLAQAVARFIEWEAFAYWVRLPLEKGDCFPIELTRELNSRCPGFVEFNNQERSADRHIPQDWDRLMSWVGDHFFQEAQREGWYDAILISARHHPRAIRTTEYCDHCEEIWESDLPTPYPTFEAWRGDADRYVDLADQV
jgi:hypothetical protein